MGRDSDDAGTSAQPTVVIVPGGGNSGPEHWQTLWENKTPGARRMQQELWGIETADYWVSSLDRTLATIEGPVVLVGHSLGVVTIAHWAARFQRPIHGALLVAMGDLENLSLSRPELGDLGALGWTPLPRQALPFPSILVGSSDDFAVTPERAAYFAQQWGSRLVMIGAAGHINVAAGYGPWPAGEALLQELLSAPAS